MLTLNFCSLYLRFLLFIVLIAICVTNAIADSGNCAHAALATSLNLVGRQATEDELITRFPPTYQDDSPVPMHVLKEAARQQGVGLSIVRLDPNSPSDEWNAAIFLINTQSGRGHYIVCKRVEQNYAVIVDSETTPKERAIPIRQLAVLWEGAALIKTRRDPWRVAESALVSILLSVGLVGLAALWARRRSPVTIALIFLSFSALGCSRSNVETTNSEAPLYFDKPIVVLESVLEQGKPHTVSLRLKRATSAPFDAQVDSIVSSCTCLKVDGRTSVNLKPGESVEINVIIDPEAKDVIAGDIVASTGNGELAHCGISGIVTTRFRLHTQHLVQRRSQENAGQIIVSRTKECGVPIKKPPVALFNSGTGVEFQLVDCVETRVGSSAVGGEVAREEHHWRYEILDGSTSGVVEFPYDDVMLEVSILD